MTSRRSSWIKLNRKRKSWDICEISLINKDDVINNSITQETIIESNNAYDKNNKEVMLNTIRVNMEVTDD
jgi:hypothetical protein